MRMDSVRRIALVARYTVKPGRYKVFHEQQPMGLVERALVNRAARRATVPPWLLEERERGIVDEWAGVRQPSAAP